MLKFEHGSGNSKTLPTLLKNKFQSKMAHFTSLDSASVCKTIHINTALHKTFILGICIFLMKYFVVIENY